MKTLRNILLVLILVLVAGIASAQTFDFDGNPNWSGDDRYSFRYVCSTDTEDIYEFSSSDAESAWTFVPQGDGGETTYVTGTANRMRITYPTPSRAVLIYNGLYPIATVAAGDKECAEADTYVPILNECLGITMPDHAGGTFVIDGHSYTIGTDGAMSFLIPQEIVWAWDLYIGDTLVLRFEQTQEATCHIVEWYQ